MSQLPAQLNISCIQVLAARPELAVFSYFGNGQNVAHVAAGKHEDDCCTLALALMEPLVLCRLDSTSAKLSRLFAAELLCCFAAKGDREVLEALLDALQSAAKAPAAEEYGGELALKEQTLTVMTMGRYVKDVINARSNNGQTPFMLACDAGCVLSLQHSLFQESLPLVLIFSLQLTCAEHPCSQACLLRQLPAG